MLPLRRSYQASLIFTLVAGALIFFTSPIPKTVSSANSPKGTPPQKNWHHPSPPPSLQLEGVTEKNHNTSPPQTTSKETSIPGPYAHGFTIFDNLFLRNGTFYIVTSDPSKFPPRREILSRPIDITDDEKMQPTDADLQVITPETARAVLGDHAIPVQGFSMIAQDSTQFMNHFYHWWGEIILGAYRVYSALAPGEDLPPPARFILPYSDGLQWRDRAGVDGPLMRAAFPSTAIETSYYWDDLIKLNQTVAFERAMIISRPAAHRSPLGGVWFKMIASTMIVSAPAKFWEPVRTSAIQNLLGYVPKLDSHGAVVSPTQMASNKPVVTYISRQGGGRRLRDADHQGLVAALEELEAEGVCEVFVARMETMSIKEQVAAAARSTIILGVHGNGLTHQIWMPPSPRSTTFEMFNPADYTFDYEILARNMGHRHYAVWNDTFATYPAGTYHEGVNFSDAFHGNDMAVSGAAVARMIRQRLTEPIFT